MHFKKKINACDVICDVGNMVCDVICDDLQKTYANVFDIITSGCDITSCM